MKFRLLLIVLMGVCSSGLTQNVSEISIPATPAFSILNYEPASVMKPASPKELSANILNSFDEDGKLLMNLGLEVSPYWLKSQPMLTREEYLNATGWQAVKQTFMLSAATVKDSVTNSNKLGTGFRFKFATGKPTTALAQADAMLQGRATVISAIQAGVMEESKKDIITSVEENLKQENLEGFIAEFRSYAVEDSASYANTPGDLKRYINNISEKFDQKGKDLQREIGELSKERMGWIAELAGAASFYSATHDKFEKAGLWLNISRVVSPTDDLNFTARYFFTSADSSINNIDFGGAYLKTLNDFSVSIEFMGRSFRAEVPDLNINNQPITRVDKDFTYRLAAQATYHLADGISVNLSLGKDFEAPFIERSGFFSIFGISYDIFRKRKCCADSSDETN